MSVLQNIIGVITSAFSTPIVSIQNISDDQVFADAIPMKASVNPQAKSFKHPLESSVTIVDHRILEPVLIKLEMIITDSRYLEVYGQIQSAFVNADILQVNTKAAIFENMIITGIPHEEDPEKFNAITIELTLEETLFANLKVKTTTEETVANPVQSDTVVKGDVESTTAGGSILTRIVNFFN